ncbi:MAG: hypothetical protein MZV65_48460 [Chromatiales bacterium]|nr:hypothetical protein [Chromatiales bacterium]
MTNQGYDNAWGWGVRIGWTGEVMPGLTPRRDLPDRRPRWTSSTSTRACSPSRAASTFPRTTASALAWKPMPALTIAGDIMWINYSGVDVDRQSAAPNLLRRAASSASSDGPGFGWEDMTVYKLGVAYDVNPAVDGARRLQLRRATRSRRPRRCSTSWRPA